MYFMFVGEMVQQIIITQGRALSGWKRGLGCKEEQFHLHEGRI